MKGNYNENDAPLSVLLREARPEAELHPGFQEEVWRRIVSGEAAERRARARTWWKIFLQRVATPRVAIGGAIALILFSGLAGVVHGSEAAKDAARGRYLASVAPSTVR